MKELEGKIVEKVFVDDKQHTLVFETNTGEMKQITQDWHA